MTGAQDDIRADRRPDPNTARGRVILRRAKMAAE